MNKNVIAKIGKYSPCRWIPLIVGILISIVMIYNSVSIQTPTAAWAHRKEQSIIFQSVMQDVTELPLGMFKSELDEDMIALKNVEPKETPAKITMRSVQDPSSKVSKPFSSCLARNSNKWLDVPRHGNTRQLFGNRPGGDASNETPYYDHPFSDVMRQYVKDMIIDFPSILISFDAQDSVTKTVFSTTLCDVKSQFVQDGTQMGLFQNNTGTSQDASFPEKLIRTWATRLMYLAIHYHQHRHAIPEAQARYSTEYSDSCLQELDTHHVGPFDYECPEAKHLIIDLGPVGLGANIRGGITPALLAGIVSGRVVHVIQRLDINGTIGQWQLASCKRGDYQCVFQPPSPCVLTYEEIQNATMLNRQEGRTFKREFSVPLGYENHKVIRMTNYFQPISYSAPPILDRLHSYAQEILSQVPSSDARLPLLRAACKSILEKDHSRGEGKFEMYAAASKVQQIGTIYSMRVPPRYQKILTEKVESVTPLNFDPERTMGMPIRASDKCGKESECLSYSQHLLAVTDFWQKSLIQPGADTIDSAGQRVHVDSRRQDPVNPTVIMTTEAKTIQQAHASFTQNTTAQSAFPYQYEFITNSFDLTPDTGLLNWFIVDADEAMLGSLATLKLQLLPRLSMGNGCSNYHMLLYDFVNQGCSASRDAEFHFLQESDNPEFRVCCHRAKWCVGTMNRQML